MNHSPNNPLPCSVMITSKNRNKLRIVKLKKNFFLKRNFLEWRKSVDLNQSISLDGPVRRADFKKSFISNSAPFGGATDYLDSRNFDI